MPWAIIHHAVGDYPEEYYLHGVQFERYTGPLLQEHLSESPVVWIRGARQVGKSTIAKAYGGEERAYLTLDDGATLALTVADPDGFVAGLPQRVTIDEVQRMPALFRAIKLQVDRHRIDGQFLLTGSANVFALPEANESLAGRMQIISVEPLAQCEIRGGGGGFVRRLFGSEPLIASPTPLEALTREGFWRLIAAGGYPEAIKRSSSAARERLFTGYLDTLLERDVREISQIKRLTELPELLEALASRSGRLLNQTDIGNALSIPRATLDRYLAILEALFIFRPQRAFHADAVLSLAKTPKAHLLDTGLACHTLGHDEREVPTRAYGPLAESFVVNELRRLLTWHPTRVRLTHFRTKRAREVDAVLQDRRGRVVGVEIKARHRVGEGDLAGLRQLQDVAGERFHRGVVLYLGDQVLPFGGFTLVPVSALWAW